MTFVETFTAVFLGLLMAEACKLLIERYIKPHMEKSLEKVENTIKKEIMSEVKND